MTGREIVADAFRRLGLAEPVFERTTNPEYEFTIAGRGKAWVAVCIPLTSHGVQAHFALIRNPARHVRELGNSYEDGASLARSIRRRWERQDRRTP